MSSSALSADESAVRFHGRIVDAEILQSDVPLQKPLRGRDGLVLTREVRIVRLRDEDGHEGLGEASRVTWLSRTHCAGAPPGTRGAGAPSLQSIARRIAAERPWAQELAETNFANDNAARSAIVTALVDLEARRRGQSAATVLAGSDFAKADDEIAVSALLGDSDPETMADEASHLAARGFTSFKIKVGTRSLDDDAHSIAAVRAAVGRVASIRLDANGAWSVEDAARALQCFSDLDADFVEEPLQDAARIAELGDAGRVALDESISNPADLERAIERGGFRVLVLKLERVGGPLAAIAMADVAARAGLDVVFTDSVESSVGRAAAVHTAAAAAARSGKEVHAVGLGGLFFLEDGFEACATAAVRAPGLGVHIA